MSNLLVINEFTRENEFLSNFHTVAGGFKYRDIIWHCSENAYQAEKCWRRVAEFIYLTPNKAKKLGKTVTLPLDWEQRKEFVMYAILKAKFSVLEMREKLLNTGDAALVEGNYWGSCTCERCGYKGKNRLGILLMALRSELKLAQKLL